MKIIRLTPIVSIKAAAVPGAVAPDGTIMVSVPYVAVNVELDDGRRVQIERPLTVAKIRAALAPLAVFDGVSEGDEFI